MDSKSVVAGIIIVLAIGAAVVAAQGVAPRGDWNPTTSNGDIILDGSSHYTVYQGEQDINDWKLPDGTNINGETLDRQPNAEEQLELRGTIPRNQRTGRYESTDGSITARVSTPSITSLRIYNTNGVRLGTNAEVPRNQRVLVEATWNYVSAEDIELQVRDPDDVNVARAALSTNPTSAQSNLLPNGFSDNLLDNEVQGAGSTGFRTAYWLLDLGELDRGRHQLRVQGVDDLTFSEARRTATINAGTSDRAVLTLGSSSASRGERVRFTVSGSSPGQYHAVAIDRSDLRSNADPNRVFRLIGDVVDVGSTNGFVYGVVEIQDNNRGVGVVDTAQLDTGSVRVELYAGESSISSARNNVGGSSVSRASTSITSGRLTTNLEGLTYVPGQRIDVQGTASPGIDDVALYVREGGTWELVPLNGRRTTSVGANGRWVARNVVLSNEDFGGFLFKFPGVLNIAVVDAADLASPPPTTLSSSELSRTTNSRTSARVTSPSFTSAFTTYNGQVAMDDPVRFSGSSVGTDQAVVAFVGQNGRVVASVERTRSGGVFENEVDLGDTRTGLVTALAFSSGRDGVFGDGRATDGNGNRVDIESPNQFRDFLESFTNQGLTASQVVSRIRAASVDSPGSDDLVVTQTFRLAEPNTQINDVVPVTLRQRRGVLPIEVGESFIVRGSTNRNPSQTEITVEATDGPDAAELGTRTVRSWDSTGLWSVTMSAGGISRGSYELQVDDGESTDTVAIQVVRRGGRSDEAVNGSDSVFRELERLNSRLQELRAENERTSNNIEQQRSRNSELREEVERLREQVNRTGRDGEGLNGFGFLVGVVSLAALLVVSWRRQTG